MLLEEWVGYTRQHYRRDKPEHNYRDNNLHSALRAERRIQIEAYGVKYFRSAAKRSYDEERGVYKRDKLRVR